jgi:hypothetical protein
LLLVLERRQFRNPTLRVSHQLFDCGQRLPWDSGLRNRSDQRGGIGGWRKECGQRGLRTRSIGPCSGQVSLDFYDFTFCTQAVVARRLAGRLSTPENVRESTQAVPRRNHFGCAQLCTHEVCVGPAERRADLPNRFVGSLFTCRHQRGCSVDL